MVIRIRRYLQLDGSGSDEKQRVAVPDVHVHGVEGQVAHEPALLPRPQETPVYPELQLQAWSRCGRRINHTEQRSRYRGCRVVVSHECEAEARTLQYCFSEFI